MRALPSIIYISLSLVIVCSVGCGAADHQRLLDKQIYSYHQKLRWSLLDQAQNYVAPAFLETWRSAHLNNSQDLKLTDIEPTLLEITQTQPPRAHFRVKVTWYRNGQMTIRQSTWDQEWHFIGSRWKLMKEKNLAKTTTDWP